MVVEQVSDLPRFSIIAHAFAGLAAVLKREDKEKGEDQYQQ